MNNAKYSTSYGKKEYARKLIESIPTSPDFYVLEKNIRAALNDLEILIFDEASELHEYCKHNTYNFGQIKARIIKEISNRVALL